MPDWLYTLRERFTANAEGWESYLAFSGFTHIADLVTLDGIMCPDVITELVDEDWNYNVHKDCRINLFRDPQYLLRRQPLDPARHQLLAILERPAGSERVPPGFTRCGFDIMDSYFGNSTLTNCRPMPEAFEPAMVNEFGLLPDCHTALEVRDKMRRLQPDDPHLGECEVWFIARMLPPG